MSETETDTTAEVAAVDPNVLAGFENLMNLIKSAGVSAEFGSPQYAALAKTNKEVKKAMEAYAAGPKARKVGGRRGRPPKTETVAEAE